MAGKSTTDTPRQGVEYAARVVTDLVTEWKMNGICEQHVRVIVWAGEEGAGPRLRRPRYPGARPDRPPPPRAPPATRHSRVRRARRRPRPPRYPPPVGPLPDHPALPDHPVLRDPHGVAPLSCAALDARTARRA
ncbi:hypothetical protein ABZ590_39175 [Streptomyces hirsutus]|uniref:hypothetical protein n=1 Tax=Streptomyces hirsutus TaxID=35620 RepID=UPI0033DBFA1F